MRGYDYCPHCGDILEWHTDEKHECDWRMKEIWKELIRLRKENEDLKSHIKFKEHIE